MRRVLGAGLSEFGAGGASDEEDGGFNTGAGGAVATQVLLPSGARGTAGAGAGRPGASAVADDEFD
jgi:hypothetical protein